MFLTGTRGTSLSHKVEREPGLNVRRKRSVRWLSRLEWRQELQGTPTHHSQRGAEDHGACQAVTSNFGRWWGVAAECVRPGSCEIAMHRERMEKSDGNPWKAYNLPTVVHALVTARLDYCSACYMGLPLEMTQMIQRVQRAAARLPRGTSFTTHTTPVLEDLHCPPTPLVWVQGLDGDL